MQTSYFKSPKLKEIEEDRLVSICTGKPKWFDRKCIDYPALYPGWDIVNTYKQAIKMLVSYEYVTIDNIQIKDEVELQKWYRDRYYKDILSKLDPLDVYLELQDKVLLCYEVPGDFCHRHLVAEWIYDNLGFQVKEL